MPEAASGQGFILLNYRQQQCLFQGPKVVKHSSSMPGGAVSCWGC